MRLLGISGSLRKDSVNTRLILAASKHFGAADFELGDLRIPLFDGDQEAASGIPETVEKLAIQIAQSDAVILSTPEYNQSLSGVLKNALDWVSRVKDNPWEAKPVMICAAAAGRSGGARAAYSLRLAMTPFRPLMVPGPEVLLPQARKAFADDGSLLDAGIDDRVQKAVAELKKYALLGDAGSAS